MKKIQILIDGEMKEVQLGKKPFRADKYGRDLKYDNYRVAENVGTIPTAGGYTGKVPNFGMLGNADVGDCGEAGIDHGFMQTNAIAGRTILFKDSNTISDYSAITGYNPKNPNTDQGTDMHDAYNYAVKTGMIDSNGKRHKLGAFLQLNDTQTQLQEVIYIYNRAGIGIYFPETAMNEFNSGKAWSDTSTSINNCEGLHYIEGIYYDENGVIIITWGKEQRMTWAFFKKYCDESYLLLDPELLNSQGVTPNGLNLDLLNSDLNVIKSGGIPITNVTPPSPQPQPTPTPTPVITPTVAIADIKAIMGTANKITKAKLISEINAVLAQC